MGALAYTFPEAARIASAKEPTIVQAVRAGALTARRIDGKGVILRTDLQTWLEAQPLF